MKNDIKKILISEEDMVQKIQMIKKVTPSLKIVARSDAYAVEGMEGMIKRLNAYIEAGADVVFPEAMVSIEDFSLVRDSIESPVLANMTEFGKTDYIDLDTFSQIGINLVLFPVTSLRAAAYNVEETYKVINNSGTQKSVLNKMQTRKDLYSTIKLHKYEEMDTKIAHTILPDDSLNKR